MSKPPVVFWLVAIIALSWNALCVADCWMTASGEPGLLRDIAPVMTERAASFPLWRTALSVMSAAAGALGAIALILRRRIAIALFLANFALTAFGFAGYDLLLADGSHRYTMAGIAISLAFVAVAGAQWIFADRAAKNGLIA